MKQISSLLLLCAVALLFQGCGLMLGRQREMAYWESLVPVTIDGALEREAAGGQPGAGKTTWQEYWRWSIGLWEKYPDAEQHKSYLIARRRDMGLPLFDGMR